MSENGQEKRETIADIVAEMNNWDNYSHLDNYAHEAIIHYAARIEAISRRAYNEIDSAMCGIESASSTDIDAVRAVLDNTIGEYYE